DVAARQPRSDATQSRPQDRDPHARRGSACATPPEHGLRVAARGQHRVEAQLGRHVAAPVAEEGREARLGAAGAHAQGPEARPLARSHAGEEAMTDRIGRIDPVRVAVVDVGSNTVRLLVAEECGDGIAAVLERKARLGLGEEVERLGRITQEKISEVALAVREMAVAARGAGCAALEVVVASPGRQAANAGRLIRALARATSSPVRVLSKDEEALLAWRGAMAVAQLAVGSAVVCDVGGGSTQLSFGEPGKDPVWLRSVDIGSLRLTAR